MLGVFTSTAHVRLRWDIQDTDRDQLNSVQTCGSYPVLLPTRAPVILSGHRHVTLMQVDLSLPTPRSHVGGCKIVALLDGDELPTSRPVRFTLGEVPGAYWVPKPVWPFWRKAPCSSRDPNPDRPARRMVTVIKNVALFPRFVFTIYLHFGLKVSVNDNARVQETTVFPADEVPPGRRVLPCQKTNILHPRPVLKLLGATCWCGQYVLVASIQHISQCTYCVHLSVS